MAPSRRLHRFQPESLCPLLFPAYINDMPESIRSTVKLFSDDSLLYRKISNKTDSVELQFQQDLDRLQEWEKKWQMAFNAEKMRISVHYK